MSEPSATPTPPRPPASSSPAAWSLLLATTVLGLVIDLWSKHAAFERVAGAPVVIRRADVVALPPAQINQLIPPHQPVRVAPYLLDFQLVLNPGAVFGIGAGKRVFFLVFTGAAIAFAVWVFARWTHTKARASHVGIGLVLAGGLGNLYDRLVFACVRDFLHPLPRIPLPFGWTWPGGARDLWPWVSNVADAFLLTGVAILLVTLWRAEDPRRA